MGNSCSCLNNISSLCSEDLSRANNQDITDNNNNKNPTRNLKKNNRVDNFESIISTNDIKSVNSNYINKSINTNNENKEEYAKTIINNTNDTINNIEKYYNNNKNIYNNNIVNNKNEFAKLHKYILRIITKKKFLKNISKYKEAGNKLFNICIENIYKSNELLSKAESNWKIKYNKNGYKQFYPKISKEEINNYIIIPDSKKTIDDSIIIQYNSEQERNPKEVNYIYKGQTTLNNIPNGFGVKYKKNGIKEEGYWNSGELKGWGQIIDYKGNVIMGQFTPGGLVNGKGVKYSYINNTLYKGDILNNKKEGKGEEISNENTYIGNFINDKKNGKGKLINIISGDIYEGDFKDDLFDGEGHYIYKISGQEYKGEYKNGLMHGKGVYEWSQGEYYKGNFFNGKKEGNGEMHWADGRSYIGPFINGRPQGIGIYDNGNNYKGEMEFINGKLNRHYFNRNYEGFDTNSLQSSQQSNNTNILS